MARVWPGFFEIMELDLLEGRTFLVTDTVDATDVVVVNESLAKHLSTDGDAIGQTLVLPGNDDEPDRGFEVIGVVRGALYTQRMNAELFTVIAALGLLLSAAGVFAVLALAVSARRREIGIRVAVGAGRLSIAKSILGPIGGSVLVGLGIGLAGAFGVTRLVGSLLWGVSPADPLALGLGVGVLLIAIVLAVAAPLRGALRIDPADLLRAE